MLVERVALVEEHDKSGTIPPSSDLDDMRGLRQVMRMSAEEVDILNVISDEED